MRRCSSETLLIWDFFKICFYLIFCESYSIKISLDQSIIGEKSYWNTVLLKQSFIRPKSHWSKIPYKPSPIRATSHLQPVSLKQSPISSKSHWSQIFLARMRLTCYRIWLQWDLDDMGFGSNEMDPSTKWDFFPKQFINTSFLWKENNESECYFTYLSICYFVSVLEK